MRSGKGCGFSTFAGICLFLCLNGPQCGPQMNNIIQYLYYMVSVGIKYVYMNTGKRAIKIDGVS